MTLQMAIYRFGQGGEQGMDDLLQFMREHGSSVCINWGEDTDNWECSWIVEGKRFTGINGELYKAVGDCSVKAFTHLAGKYPYDPSKQIHSPDFANPVEPTKWKLPEDLAKYRTDYPVVLADWSHHSKRYQAWNQKERVWIVHDRAAIDAASGPEWELLWSL